MSKEFDEWIDRIKEGLEQAYGVTMKREGNSLTVSEGSLSEAAIQEFLVDPKYLLGDSNE